MSGHGKKSTEPGALTSWRRQREGLVRTRKEIDQARRTHFLETTKGGTCQDTERNRPSQAHSLPADDEGGTSQDKENNRLSEAHSLPEDGRGRDFSGTERNRPSEAHSQAGDGRGNDLSAHSKKSTDQGTLTAWRRQRERLISTQQEIGRPRHTHFLETAEGATCQDTERNRLSKAHSLPGDDKGRVCQDTERNRPSEAYSLPGDSRERLVGTRKEID